MMASRIYRRLFGLTILATAGFGGVLDGVRSPTAISAEVTWTIPGAGSTAGLNNTRFVSDLALTNPGSSPANVTITFVGPGDLPARSIPLAAGATTVYRNVLEALWGASGLVGALSVRSDQPLVLRARTYNTAATGTFGVALPVYASDRLLTEGQAADTVWVQQDPSGSSGFRTNVGVVFPDTAGGDAIVTFFDASGAVVGTQTYSSAAAGFQQLSIASVAPGLVVGRAQIAVARGHAAAYAVGVDNVTGDTSLYPFAALPAGVQDVVVNGVARLNGRNNTFFRTDARLFNPTSNPATVTVRFHAAGASNPTPQSATVNVPAGRIVEVVDVLGSILNAPVGSGGAVRFTSNEPVAILCRTSNVDPQGVVSGTYGAQQHPVPLASFLSSADPGAVVTAVRQDASFRTNVGFTAGPDGAQYLLTLKNAQGAPIGTTTAGLGAFGWTQPNVADLFAGTSIPADATLLVEVTSGTVDVYDASLDNASGDLVVTPIAPLPVTLPASASIGPAGGSIRSADGRLTLKVPAGALATPTTVSIGAAENTAPNAIGAGYSLTPVGLAFARPAQLVLSYSDADVDGSGPGALGLASQDGTNWFGLLGGSVDAVTRTLRVPVTSTSPGPSTKASGTAAPNGHLGAYGSVILSPTNVVLPVGGRKHFGLGYVGPASAQNATPGTVLLAVQNLMNNVETTWYLDGVIFGSARVGRIFPTPTNNADYDAPDCLPVPNPIRLAVKVNLHGTGATTWLTGTIRIIEKEWRIEVIYRVRSLCSGIPPPAPAFSVSFDRSHDGNFSLDPDGRVIDFLSGLNHFYDITSAGQWCVENAGCSSPSLQGVDQLVLNGVTGRLFGDTARAFFDLTLEVDVPGTGASVIFTCGTGSFILPIVHGAPPHVTQPVTVPYPSLVRELEFILPSTRETVEIKLTPIPPPACP